MVKINLSTILGKYRMSQAELARKTGIRPSTICDIYNEMCDRINLEHLDRICEVLECDISDILEYQPNKIKKTGKYLIVDRKKHNKNTKHLADEWNLCKVFFICRKHFCNNMQKWLIQFFSFSAKSFFNLCEKRQKTYSLIYWKNKTNLFPLCILCLQRRKIWVMNWLTDWF